MLDNDDSDENSKVYIDVQRKYVLKDAFRECKKKKFDPKKLLRVGMSFQFNLLNNSTIGYLCWRICN